MKFRLLLIVVLFHTSICQIRVLNLFRPTIFSHKGLVWLYHLLAHLFDKIDLYLSKRWRRVQYLANIFWTRWRQEYLDSINKRRKWTSQRRNIEVNDVVLICDENTARSDWRLARVVECFTSKDNLVRSVKLQVATSQLDNKGKRLSDVTYLTRPIHKLILLIEA